MNKIKRKEKLNGKKKITLSQGMHEKMVFLSDTSFQLEVTIEENASLEVFHYAKNTSGTIKVYLKGEHAKIIYHYNTKNETKNEASIAVFHQQKKTESYLFFHGWNSKDEMLSFQVDVFIPKGMSGSVAMQENRIYNSKTGFAKIFPNLYIEEFDVEANHASFTGPFEEAQVFYLKTRGLSQKVIEKLLIEGLLTGEGLSEDEKFDFFQIRKEG